MKSPERTLARTSLLVLGLASFAQASTAQVRLPEDMTAEELADIRRRLAYDPIFGHLQEYDFKIRFVDADTYVTEIWFKDPVHTRGGPPFMMIEITSTRR